MRVALLFLVSGASIAHAQAGSPETEEPTSLPPQGRELFDAGARAFADGRFEDALTHFQAAYDVSRQPPLLYNIAISHDRLDNVERSISFYERYLEQAPELPNRSMVERRLTILRARLSTPEEPVPAPSSSVDTADDTPDDTADDAPADLPPRRIGVPVALFTLAGLSGLAGIVSGVRSLRLRGELESSCPNRVCSDDTLLRDRALTMTRLSMAADILLALSAAGAVSGLLTALLLRPKAESRLEASVLCDVHQCGLTLRGRL